MEYVATTYIKNNDILQMLDPEQYQLIYKIDETREKRNEGILGCFMMLSGEYNFMSRTDMKELLFTMRLMQANFNCMPTAYGLNESDAEDLKIIADYVGQCVKLLQRLTDENIIQDIIIVVTQEGYHESF